MRLPLYEEKMTYYETSMLPQAETPSLKVDFLVLPGSSMMTLACAADPLRAANRVTGRKLFDWQFLSADGEPPIISAGLTLPISGRFEPGARRDLFAVIAGFGTAQNHDRPLLSAIYRAAKQAALTAGIESGPWLLARAGLLDGRAATTHWEDFEDFASAFPAVDLRQNRYVVDSPFITTSGALSTFDMMIDLIRQQAGSAAALDVASCFIYDASRGASDMQASILFGLDGRYDRRLIEAIRIMEACIDGPITTAAIARRVSMSARGLELLFRREVKQTPGAYFLSLRLNAARRLLMDTRRPLAEIASRTGFSSTATLARAFRRAFDQTPTDLRNANQRPGKHFFVSRAL